MKQLILGIILSGATHCALAQHSAPDQKGWIVGGGIGTARLSIKPQNQPGLQSSKESTALFTAFGGYNYTDWFGIEFDFSTSSDFDDENTTFDAYIIGTSFTPKFSYQFNNNFGTYVKLGLQYIAYEQDRDSYDYRDITWNGIEPFFGTGLQYSFNSGVRARLDYKFSELTLERSENSRLGYDLYDEEIDLTFSALTFTVNYQF